jgi:adenylate cyclase class 2
MAKGTQETEIKLAVPNVQTARRLLRGAGFRVFRRRVFEVNLVFDTEDLTLRKNRTLLRVREAGGHATFTFKGVPLTGRHKSREELEMEIPSARTMSQILERLGFRPAFRYEKFRSEYRAAGGAGIATLDETPIGVFMELEGTGRWIDRMARKLGFTHDAYITLSYSSLYLAWCNERGATPANMIFPVKRSGRG